MSIKNIRNLFHIDNLLLFVLSIFFVFSFSYGKDISILKFLVLVIITFLFSLFILKLIEKLNLKSNQKVNIVEYFIYSVIIIGALFFSISNNSLFSTDFFSIKDDIQLGIYNDWHPFLYTVIFIKFPLLIYPNNFSCMIFQGIFIFLSMIYLSYFFRKYFLNMKQTIIILLLFVWNPCFLQISSVLLKDVPFSFSLMLFTIFLIEIVMSKGTWILKRKNKFLFAIISFFMIFTRHNGIVCFCLALITLILCYKKYRKFYTLFFLLFIVSKMIITGPIYQVLGVDHNLGAAEMLGVPLNQIRYISGKTGGLSKKHQIQIEKAFPKKCWNIPYKKYLYFNAIKFQDCTYNPLVLRDDSFSYIRIWLDLATKHPKLAIQNYLELTSIYWKIDKNKSFNWLQSNDKINHNKVYTYSHFITSSILKYLFLDMGSSLYLIFFSMILLLRKKRRNLDQYVPYIIVLSNFIVACCFVTGNEMRFTYSSILCAYPLIIYSLSQCSMKLVNLK